MEQFRQIGEVLGSMKALMILQDDIQINRRQCCFLFEIFSLAFDTLSHEIKKNLKMGERNTKWKPLEQPLKEVHRVFKEGESYLRQCLDCKNWWVKAIILHNNQDCVEFHIHNLLSYFSIAIEAIETAGEISGLDLDEMKKKRIMWSSKYDRTWNDPKLFQWKYGQQYLVCEKILSGVSTSWKEDQWLLVEMIKEKKITPLCKLSKYEHNIGDLIVKKVNREECLFPTSILTGAKDYQVRRRLGSDGQYKEIQWLGESFCLRHFYGEPALLKPEISALSGLSHPNITHHLCGFHDEEKKEYLLVMDLMNKDLNGYIKDMCGSRKRLIPFSFPATVDIMLQIARGMEYLHSKKIYHGDLNPSNVLLKPRSSSLEGCFLVKVTGFGLRNIKRIHTMRTSSPRKEETFAFIWHAPEVLTEQERPGGSCKYKYSEKADVYSFGMLCFELLTGKVPFEDGHLQGDKMSRNIRAGERPLFPFALPKYLATLTKKCWHTDPNQRPSFSSICRILRYIQRALVINSHLIQPDISSIVQVDFCDVEAGFMNKFPTEVSNGSTLVSQIPFELFSYRLEEKEKMFGKHRTKSWDSHSGVAIPSHIDEIDNKADESSPIRDTRTDCSDNPDKKISTSVPNKNICPIIGNDRFILESSKEKVALPPLRKSQSITSIGRSALRMQETVSEIPEKSPLPLRKTITISNYRPSDTSEIPEKKEPEKKVSVMARSSSVRTSKDSGNALKQKAQRKTPTTLNSQGKSVRVTAERSPTSRMTERSVRYKARPAKHFTD